MYVYHACMYMYVLPVHMWPHIIIYNILNCKLLRLLLITRSQVSVPGYKVPLRASSGWVHTCVTYYVRGGTCITVDSSIVSIIHSCM